MFGEGISRTNQGILMKLVRDVEHSLEEYILYMLFFFPSERSRGQEIVYIQHL